MQQAELVLFSPRLAFGGDQRVDVQHAGGVSLDFRFERLLEHRVVAPNRFNLRQQVKLPRSVVMISVLTRVSKAGFMGTFSFLGSPRMSG